MSGGGTHFSSMQFGNVSVDRKTGQTKLAPKIQGGTIDTNLIIQEQVEASKAIAIPIQDNIDQNSQKIAALKKLQDLTSQLMTTLTDLDEPLISLFGEKSIFTQTYINAFCNNGMPLSNYASLTPTSDQTSGSFSLQINKIAQSDTRTSTTSITNNLTSALNLNGNLIVDSVTIPITPTMTLTDVITQINNNTSTTGVSAQATSLTGDGTNYILTLTNSALATPIALSTSDPSILSGLNLSATDNTVQSLSAQIVYNGNTYYRTTNSSIDDIVAGVSMNIIQPSPLITAQFTPDQNGTIGSITKCLQCFNSLAQELNVHNSFNIDTKTADPNAVLAGKTILLTLKQILNSFVKTVPGINNSNLQALADIGINLEQDGTLNITKPNTFQDAVFNNYDQLKYLFSNHVVNSNPAFLLTGFGPQLDSSIAGQPITLTVSALSGGGYNATFDLNGTSYPTTIQGNIITGANSTPFKNVSVSYAGMASLIPGGPSVSTTMTVTQGIADSLYEQLKATLDPTTGAFTNEIEQLNKSNKTLEQQIDRINKKADRTRETLELQYQKVLKAWTEYEKVNDMLNSYMQALSSN